MKKEKLPNGKRRCWGCRQIKEIESFSPDRNQKYGKAYICKNCKNKRSAEWRRKNKKIIKRCSECGRIDSKATKSMPKYKPFGIRWAVLNRDNFTCQYCGRKAPDVELEVDHIYPKSKGGEYVMNNLFTACKECNLGKRDTIITNLNLIKNI